MEKKYLYVVSHTHWDREWYQTYQTYRYRLVRMMDDLLDNLEKTPEFQVFHLDGQTIILQDYLEIRLENKERLKKLISDGRIVIGPWYVMPDEFLVSGESLVKNLQIGHKICAEYGVSPMSNGYVVDIFGHNSQFPQILNGFDIHSATLYRGIADYNKDAFRWRSPDGSEVAVIKLERERSYSNFYFAVRWPYEETGFDPQDAVERMKKLLEHTLPRATSDRLVMMDGVDHIDMEPEMPEMMKLFEANILGIEFIHGRIDEYFQGLDTSGLDVIEGCLYHLGEEGINNQLLKNVLSSMVYLKQSNDDCEIRLTSFAEPLNAFTEWYSAHLPRFSRNDYSLSPRRTYLDRAWELLISNHPHDSICGCSRSDVHRDNEYRFRQVRQMADITVEDSIRQITRNIRVCGKYQGSMLLYNPSQKPVDSVIVVKLVVDNQPERNYRFYDSEGKLLDVQILSEEPFVFCNERLRKLVSFDNKLELTAAVRMDIPAFGYTVVSYDNLQNRMPPEKKCYDFEEYHRPKRLNGSMMKAPNQIDNGKLVITVNAAGLLDVLDKLSGKTYHDLLLLEDCGDVGEGWNYRSPQYDRKIYSTNRLMQYAVESDGPLACVISLTYELELPEKADVAQGRRSEKNRKQIVTTKVTILKDSQDLLFETTLDNTIENHRLRVCFPTGLNSDHFYTKTPYDMVKWDIVHEDSSEFKEIDTLVHPSQGITVLADETNTVALYVKGLYEVEVMDNESRTIALTLMRAIETESGLFYGEDTRMQRKMTFEYALSFRRQTLTQAEINGEAYRAATVTQHFTPNPQASSLPAQDAFIRIDAQEKLVSAITTDSGLQKKALTLRLFDVSGNEEEITVSLKNNLSRAYLVNLKGDIIEELPVSGNQVCVPCKAHAVTTVVVESGE